MSAKKWTYLHVSSPFWGISWGDNADTDSDGVGPLNSFYFHDIGMLSFSSQIVWKSFYTLQL